MKVEVSSGIIVFREQDNTRCFLLLDRKEGFLDFPKGHVEQGETEEEAAIRETFEETGLTITPIQGFRKEMEYWFKFKGQLIHKKVVMFTGESPNNDSPVVSFEHMGYRWLDYDEAHGQLKFDNQKQLLSEVQDYLNNRGH